MRDCVEEVVDVIEENKEKRVEVQEFEAEKSSDCGDF